MSNEWDTWKVGDKLSWNGYIFAAITPRKAGQIYEIVEIDPNGFFHISDGSKWDPLFMSPITRYWTLVHSWVKGDRVQRESINNHTDAVIAGARGTVESVERDELIVSWDMRFKYLYELPLRHPYFSKITTGQVTKPVLHCTRCGEYNEYAEPNMPDGTHRCWQCRKDPWR